MLLSGGHILLCMQINKVSFDLRIVHKHCCSQVKCRARSVANSAWLHDAGKVNERAKEGRKCEDANVSCTQIWMDRFKQNGNNESIVTVIQRVQKINTRIHTHIHTYTQLNTYSQHRPIPNNKKVEMRRQGIWRRFACFAVLFLSLE